MYGVEVAQVAPVLTQAYTGSEVDTVPATRVLPSRQRAKEAPEEGKSSRVGGHQEQGEGGQRGRKGGSDVGSQHVIAAPFACKRQGE